MLNKNDSVPLDEEFVNEREKKLTLRDFLGKWVIVYFYPKDNTPGCTLEAEEFRDRQNDFNKQNAVILGVSKDSCLSHENFISKKQLTFTLISDTNHTLMKAFGTWGERRFMGRTYNGTSRSTFLLDGEGTIAHVWQTVKPDGHAKEVLETLTELQKKQS